MYNVHAYNVILVTTNRVIEVILSKVSNSHKKFFK